MNGMTASFHRAALPPPGTRILVADDDPDMRDLIAATLTADGYDVVEARDGAELLTKLAADSVVHRGDEFRLVLSDVRMPLISGLEVARRLCAANFATPFVLMTAFGDATLRENAARLGVHLLEKPFDLDDLRTVVMHSLRPNSKRPPQTGK
jgi:CheY-like chemotaxis protein